MNVIVFLGTLILYGLGFIFAVWGILLHLLLATSVIAEMLEKKNDTN